MMNDLELTPAVFSILSGLLEERIGFQYTQADISLLQGKVSTRAQDAGFDSLLDYYYFLRYDSAGEQELDELIEALVVGETYFFREWASIKTLVDNYIVPWCAQGLKPRIWSAACSTGEEPLSLAMLLDDRKVLDQVEIVASDISFRALEKAKTGHFGRRSIRQIPEASLYERYITKQSDSSYLVSSDLIDHVRWERLNFFADSDFQHLGPFDAIVCRNVLIYFSDKKIQQLLERIDKSLKSDGILVVGASESLLRYGRRFVLEEKGGSFVYRKSGSNE